MGWTQPSLVVQAISPFTFTIGLTQLHCLYWKMSAAERELMFYVHKTNVVCFKRTKKTNVGFDKREKEKRETMGDGGVCWWLLE